MLGHTASTPLVAFGHTAKVAQNGKFLFFLFKFLEVSENQIPHRKLQGLSVGELFSPPFRRLRGVVILNLSQHWPMFMKMAQQVVSGLKVQHIVFKNPISSGWQNTKNLLYVCEIIFIVFCIFGA